MASMFKRGFKAVNDEKKRQEENRSKGGQIWKFFIQNDGDEAFHHQQRDEGIVPENR